MKNNQRLLTSGLATLILIVITSFLRKKYMHLNLSQLETPYKKGQGNENNLH